jgi:hypothetical protein
MTPLLPAPDPSESGDSSGPKAGANRRKRCRTGQDAKIPNVDELLTQLLRLNGLVAMNMLSTSRAGVIQRGLRAILDVQLKRTQEGQGALPQDALAELCRKDPNILHLLEPLLN